VITLRTGMALTLMLSVVGCSTEQKKGTEPLVINVLDKALYDDCHIPGSVQVDFDKAERYAQSYPKDQTIVVYCSNYACTASHFVTKKLLAAGYTNVRVYAGGMAEWFLAGYPVEGPAQQGYLQKEIVAHEDQSEALPTIDKKELAELLKIV
jgi:rhodanese-related sulfurtransferase